VPKEASLKRGEVKRKKGEVALNPQELERGKKMDGGGKKKSLNISNGVKRGEFLSIPRGGGKSGKFVEERTGRKKEKGKKRKPTTYFSTYRYGEEKD